VRVVTEGPLLELDDAGGDEDNATAVSTNSSLSSFIISFQSPFERGDEDNCMPPPFSIGRIVRGAGDTSRLALPPSLDVSPAKFLLRPGLTFIDPVPFVLGNPPGSLSSVLPSRSTMRVLRFLRVFEDTTIAGFIAGEVEIGDWVAETFGLPVAEVSDREFNWVEGFGDMRCSIPNPVAGGTPESEPARECDCTLLFLGDDMDFVDARMEFPPSVASTARLSPQLGDVPSKTISFCSLWK